MLEVEVLVDWQNVLGGWRHSTRSRGRSEIDAEDVVAHLVGHIREAACALTEKQQILATGRVYGSGLTPNDPFGLHIRSALSRHRISERKFKLTLYPVERPVHSADEPLQVSLCPKDVQHKCRQSDCTRTVWEQKLADTMIVADTAYFGMFSTIGVIVISDDLDMVPGLLLAAQLRRAAGGNPPTELVWYRPGRSARAYAPQYSRHFTTIGGEI